MVATETVPETETVGAIVDTAGAEVTDGQAEILATAEVVVEGMAVPLMATEGPHTVVDQDPMVEVQVPMAA